MFGTWTIAVTSRRRDSSNVSLVIIDKLQFGLSKPPFLFEKLQNRGQTDRPTYGKHLRIKYPCRRLKTIQTMIYL